MGNIESNEYEMVPLVSCCPDANSALDEVLPTLSLKPWTLTIIHNKTIISRKTITLVSYQTLHEKLGKDLCHQIWHACRDRRALLALNSITTFKENTILTKITMYSDSDYSIILKCRNSDGSKIIFWIYQSDSISDRTQYHRIKIY